MKKLLAVCTTALLAAGAMVLGISAPASAHTSAVTGTAVCETDGTYTVNWTYKATNVPNGAEAETKVIKNEPAGSVLSGDGVLKGGQLFLSVWEEHKINNPGVPVRTGNWSANFKQSNIPATASKAVVMVQTDWHGHSEDPVGEVTLPKDCKPEQPTVPDKPVFEPTVVVTPATDCESGITTITTVTTTRNFELVNNVWVEIEPTVVPTTTTRPATVEECPLPEEPEEPVLKTVIPLAVAFDDFCGIADDRTNIPTDVEGVNYNTSYNGINTVTVTASPKEGYVFAEDVVRAWTHVFTNEECPVEEPPVVVPPTEEPPVVTPPATPNCVDLSYDDAQSLLASDSVTYGYLDGDKDGIACGSKAPKTVSAVSTLPETGSSTNGTLGVAAAAFLLLAGAAAMFLSRRKVTE